MEFLTNVVLKSKKFSIDTFDKYQPGFRTYNVCMIITVCKWNGHMSNIKKYMLYVFDEYSRVFFFLDYLLSLYAYICIVNLFLALNVYR